MGCKIRFEIDFVYPVLRDNKLILGDFIRDLVALESGGSGGVVWRIRSSPTKLVQYFFRYPIKNVHTSFINQVCAVGSRNGTEETKLMVLDFDAEVK